MQLQPDIVFDNHYTLTRLLGRGGFSEVWLAHDSYMDLDVALKIYAPGQGMDNTSIKEFRHEIKDVFNLSHSNLLTPKYLGIYEQMPYLLLTYCQYGAVTQQIGKMSEQQIWALIHDVASGLAYLHQRDIVHQDIKPDNILMDDGGNYVITDFGISTKARSTLRKSVIGGPLTAGTMAYMGPERFSKDPAPIKASDIWSFGAMVFELVTGNVPFGEMGGGMQKNGAEIPNIKENVSLSLKEIIEQMLTINTWDRPIAAKLVEIAKSHFNDALIASQPQEAQRQEQEKAEEELRNTTLSISQSDFTASANGDVINLVVKSNREWEITSKPSWVLHKVNSENLELSVDYNPNPYINRQGEVIVRTKNGAKEANIIIEQHAGNGEKPPTATIHEIWADHNIMRDNKIGMLIHVKFAVDYMFDKPLTVFVFFKNIEGEMLKDLDKKYFNDGIVYIESKTKGTYYNTRWDDFTLFMPYEQLNFPKGTLNNEPLRLDLGIWDDYNNRLLGEMKVFNFNVTY